MSTNQERIESDTSTEGNSGITQLLKDCRSEKPDRLNPKTSTHNPVYAQSVVNDPPSRRSRRDDQFESDSDNNLTTDSENYNSVLLIKNAQVYDDTLDMYAESDNEQTVFVTDSQPIASPISDILLTNLQAAVSEQPDIHADNDPQLDNIINEEISFDSFIQKISFNHNDPDELEIWKHKAQILLDSMSYEFGKTRNLLQSLLRSDNPEENFKIYIAIVSKLFQQGLQRNPRSMKNIFYNKKQNVYIHLHNQTLSSSISNRQVARAPRQPTTYISSTYVNNSSEEENDAVAMNAQNTTSNQTTQQVRDIIQTNTRLASKSNEIDAFLPASLDFDEDINLTNQRLDSRRVNSNSARNSQQRSERIKNSASYSRPSNQVNERQKVVTSSQQRKRRNNVSILTHSMDFFDTGYKEANYNNHDLEATPGKYVMSPAYSSHRSLVMDNESNPPVRSPFYTLSQNPTSIHENFIDKLVRAFKEKRMSQTQTTGNVREFLVDNSHNNTIIGQFMEDNGLTNLDAAIEKHSMNELEVRIAKIDEVIDQTDQIAKTAIQVGALAMFSLYKLRKAYCEKLMDEESISLTAATHRFTACLNNRIKERFRIENSTNYDRSEDGDRMFKEDMDKVVFSKQTTRNKRIQRGARIAEITSILNESILYVADIKWATYYDKTESERQELRDQLRYHMNKDIERDVYYNQDSDPLFSEGRIAEIKESSDQEQEQPRYLTPRSHSSRARYSHCSSYKRSM